MVGFWLNFSGMKVNFGYFERIYGLKKRNTSINLDTNSFLLEFNYFFNQNFFKNQLAEDFAISHDTHPPLLKCNSFSAFVVVNSVAACLRSMRASSSNKKRHPRSFYKVNWDSINIKLYHYCFDVNIMYMHALHFQLSNCSHTINTYCLRSISIVFYINDT